MCLVHATEAWSLWEVNGKQVRTKWVKLPLESWPGDRQTMAALCVMLHPI